MRTLEQLQEEIHDTEALISETERALLTDPSWADSLRVNLTSLRKLQSNLGAEFAQAANRLGLDVCRYRLFSDGPNEEDGLKISGLATVLNEFQLLFSLIFEALKRHEPKRTAHISPETASVTALRFGHAFAGSIGFAMTLPNELMLLGGSEQDHAMQTLFDLARSKDTHEVLQFAKQLGPAPIRSVYRWATQQVTSALGADIRWTRLDLDRGRLFIQIPELERLREIIELTSEAEEKPIELTGLLVQADLERSTFRIKPDFGEEIHGDAERGVLDLADGLTLNRVYKCTMLQTTILRLSMDTDETRYKLLKLERIIGT